jgi:hypothetical protein
MGDYAEDDDLPNYGKENIGYGLSPSDEPAPSMIYALCTDDEGMAEQSVHYAKLASRAAKDGGDDEILYNKTATEWLALSDYFDKTTPFTDISLKVRDILVAEMGYVVEKSDGWATIRDPGREQWLESQISEGVRQKLAGINLLQVVESHEMAEVKS